ncbi:hypothetical protein V1478_012466 [Vespula squamosa]|uniref:Uncharacterized protein n=1 Tax=Vespula squamosa TaxID=30214 RepID=A0ABD2ADI8_VESSQ
MAHRSTERSVRVDTRKKDKIRSVSGQSAFLYDSYATSLLLSSLATVINVKQRVDEKIYKKEYTIVFYNKMYIYNKVKNLCNLVGDSSKGKRKINNDEQTARTFKDN